MEVRPVFHRRVVPPPGLEQLPAILLNEPSRHERLQSETDLFGFTVSGHPLELFDDGPGIPIVR
jgi:hypothetical protein